MNGTELLFTVLITAGVTFATRLISFLLFPAGRKAPAFVTWLGRQLPGAVMMMLVIYCLKDINPSVCASWIPSFAGVALTVVLHLWKKQMILSISGGTAVYMLLIRVLG